MEEPKPKNKTVWIVLIIILALIVVGGAVSLVTYFALKAASLEAQLSSKSTTSSTTASTTSTTSSAAGIVSTETPRAVSDSFLKYTLGTLPNGANVNLEAAKEYADDSLKTRMTDEGFVPLFYGIQDGPSKVEFLSENINGNSASVKYNATFGDTMIGWVFTLTKTADGWKVSEFTSDAQ